MGNYPKRQSKEVTFTQDELELILKCVAHHGTKYATYDLTDELRCNVQWLLRQSYPREGHPGYFTHDVHEGA